MVANSPITENPAIMEGGAEKKAKFVPKRRTPYLLQEEVIKQAEETRAKENSQLEVKKESIDTNSKNIESSEQKGQRQKLLERGLSDNVNNYYESPYKESISSQVLLTIDFYEEVTRLYGLQKKLAFYFVQCCGNRGQTFTGPITLETLCKVAGSTTKTIKKIIQRMIEKRLIVRKNGKRGKGGFAIFELDQKFIDVVKLQAELEHDYTAMNTQINNAIQPKATDILPEEWEKINLVSLQEAFKLIKTHAPQDFGKSQLKIIYNQSKNKLSASDVQRSVTKFAYGLKYFSSHEPYNIMENPAAILFTKLKNGDIWEETRYLSPEEITLFNIYTNVSKETDENIDIYFSKWKNKEREKKYDYYKKQLSSTHYYDDKKFTEMAWKDYEEKIWPSEKRVIISRHIGIDDPKIIDQFEYVLKAKSKN